MAEVVVTCDGLAFRLSDRSVRGDVLKSHLVGEGRTDRDLFLEAPGLAADTRIEYDGTLLPADGMRFYSAPRAMSAG